MSSTKRTSTPFGDNGRLQNIDMEVACTYLATGCARPLGTPSRVVTKTQLLSTEPALLNARTEHCVWEYGWRLVDVSCKAVRFVTLKVNKALLKPSCRVLTW